MPPATTTTNGNRKREASQVGAESSSIIALDKFIRATRDSGYKGTSSAIAELVDNAVQAGARHIDVQVEQCDDDQYPVRVSVRDDGAGMDRPTLRRGLRFGGSTRFNDRAGLGRYGMGLPNASLSQARRVEVYTWQARDGVAMSYLDVDEIAAGEMTLVPPPRKAAYPLPGRQSKSGTIVTWLRCDRLDNRRVSTLAGKLTASLGRRFRYFIWKGIVITVNGEQVLAVDPLFLNADSVASGAHQFGDILEYEVRSELDDGSSTTGLVRVKFSELPVHKWQKLSNEEKGRLGISKGAGVSIVRGGREVDYGWFLLGSKRRENYDDWWRCEVQFDPVLDEAFGITHTKQQIRPRAELAEVLVPDIEATARALNARARRAHLSTKASDRVAPSEEVASNRDHRLPAIPDAAVDDAAEILAELKRQHPPLREPEKAGANRMRYRIVESTVRDTSFYAFTVEKGRFVLILNPTHPFYRKVYRPLVDAEGPREHEIRTQLELLLLAAARAEASSGGTAAARKIRRAWSDTLATFFDG